MVDIVGSATEKDRSELALPLSSKLIASYQNFLQEAASLFPKVDQKLLMSILRFQTTYSDWEGSVLLRVVYPAHGVDMNEKKEWIYSKYQRMSQVEEDRTLRFKGIRIYVEDIEKLLAEDPEIEYITGAATFAPSDGYTA